MAENASGGELILSTGSAFSIIKATDTGIGSSSALEFKPSNGANTVLHLRQDAFFIGVDAIADPKITLGTNGSAEFAGEVECTTAGDGIILASPNGTRYRITVADDGTISAAAA